MKRIARLITACMFLLAASCADQGQSDTGSVSRYEYDAHERFADLVTLLAEDAALGLPVHRSSSADEGITKIAMERARELSRATSVSIELMANGKASLTTTDLRFSFVKGTRLLDTTIPNPSNWEGRWRRSDDGLDLDLTGAGNPTSLFLCLEFDGRDLIWESGPLLPFRVGGPIRIRRL